MSNTEHVSDVNEAKSSNRPVPQGKVVRHREMNRCWTFIDAGRITVFVVTGRDHFWLASGEAGGLVVG